MWIMRGFSRVKIDVVCEICIKVRVGMGVEKE
jgi:hypothetical protein